jgi:hypothetical protein
MGPRLQRMSDGSLRFSELAPWFVGVLVQLPDLLDSDQPEEVSRRLYPDPSDDEEIKEAWDKFVRPELFALVASAREIVLQDIGNLRLGADPDPRGEDSELLPPGLDVPGLAMCTLDIPGNHVQAWISALNVARLTLSTRFELEDNDMAEPDDEDLDDDETDIEDLEEDFDPANVFDMRRIAVAQIHLLGFLQQMLIEEENPPPSDANAPWSPAE